MYSMNRTSAFDRPAELDQVAQLVVVDAADDDGVDLEAAPNTRCAACMPSLHARRARRSGSSATKRSRRSVSRLTVTRRRPAAASAVDLSASRTPLVVSARSASPAWPAASARATARSRRSSGSPPVSRSRSTPSDEEDVDERADLLEVQHVLARQPDVVRPPACSTRSAGCSGRSPTAAGCAADGRSVSVAASEL